METGKYPSKEQLLKRIDEPEQSKEQVADLILGAVNNTLKDLKGDPNRQHRFMKARILEYLEYERAQTEARVRIDCAERVPDSLRSAIKYHPVFVPDGITNPQEYKQGVSVMRQIAVECLNKWNTRAELAAQEQVWVSVEDRLPNIGDFVLVFGKSTIAKCRLSSNNNWIVAASNDVEPFSTTTHWMHLPPAPDVEGE